METPLKGYYSEEQARMDEVRAKEFKRREKRRKIMRWRRAKPRMTGLRNADGSLSDGRRMSQC